METRGRIEAAAVLQDRLPVVAIDGPAASGKGTLARAIASVLAFDHLDTGSLYRRTAMALIDAGHGCDDAVAATAIAKELAANPMCITSSDSRLRRDDVGVAAARIASMPPVRAALTDLQRSFARSPPGGYGAVLDGRDIASVICPDADIKLYVTADIRVRARRRVEELQAAGLTATYEDVLADMKDRDARDAGREVAPLVVAKGATVVDTTDLAPGDVLKQALSIVRAGLGASVPLDR